MRLASFRKIAAASGGAPAGFRVISWPSPLAPFLLPVSQPHAGAAAVLVDEQLTRAPMSCIDRV
jgi:hypothetical protein